MKKVIMPRSKSKGEKKKDFNDIYLMEHVIVNFQKETILPKYVNRKVRNEKTNPFTESTVFVSI